MVCCTSVLCTGYRHRISHGAVPQVPQSNYLVFAIYVYVCKFLCIIVAYLLDEIRDNVVLQVNPFSYTIEISSIYNRVD